jgi:hypothetical protein
MTKKDTVYPLAEAIPAASEPIVSAVQAQPIPPLAQAQAQTSYSVQVPEGCGPFDLIRVPLAGGQLYDVQVLDGYTEGMIFQVAVPSPGQQQQQQQQQQHQHQHQQLIPPMMLSPPPQVHVGRPVVQNELPDNYIAPGANMQMKMDKRPTVTPGMEHRTVSIQLTDRG